MNHAMLQTTRIAIRITGENLTDLRAMEALRAPVAALRRRLNRGRLGDSGATHVPGLRPMMCGISLLTTRSRQLIELVQIFFLIWRSPFDTRYILIKTCNRGNAIYNIHIFNQTQIVFSSSPGTEANQGSLCSALCLQRRLAAARCCLIFHFSKPCAMSTRDSCLVQVDAQAVRNFWCLGRARNNQSEKEKRWETHLRWNKMKYDQYDKLWQNISKYDTQMRLQTFVFWWDRSPKLYVGFIAAICSKERRQSEVGVVYRGSNGSSTLHWFDHRATGAWLHDQTAESRALVTENWSKFNYQWVSMSQGNRAKVTWH